MSDQMIFKRYKMKYLLNRTQYRQITESLLRWPDETGISTGKNTICNQLSQATSGQKCSAPCL